MSRFAVSIRVALVFALFVGLVSARTWQSPTLSITYPTSNSAVAAKVIEIEGVGADPAGTIQVEVMTDRWYLQDGSATINVDGSFTYSPVHLGGLGEFNNHAIRVTVLKAGKRVASATVRGIRRK
jgi:hypothetical protein